MEYAYPVVGLVLGVGLVGVSVVTAFVYTPYSSSTIDTVVTAFTGITLQVGDFVAVASATAVVFDVLATQFGVRYSLLVPFVFGYVITHVTIYYSCLRITDVQSEPLDPDFDIRENPLRVVALSIPGALVVLAPRKREPSKR